MLASGEQNVQVESMPLEIVWRNPAALAQAHLRAKEASSPCHKWAEQAKKIRARRANWNIHHSWAA